MMIVITNKSDKTATAFCLMESKSNFKKQYTVSVYLGIYSCECPARKPCKHINEFKKLLQKDRKNGNNI